MSLGYVLTVLVEARSGRLHKLTWSFQGLGFRVEEVPFFKVGHVDKDYSTTVHWGRFGVSAWDTRIRNSDVLNAKLGCC